jgi:hypothetical protein
VPGRWGRAAQVSGPSMHAVVTSTPCLQRRIVATSSSATASSGPVVQLVHNATVNGRPVPLRGEVMVVSPDAAECQHHECGQPSVVAGIQAVGLARLTPPGRLHSVCWADRISAARSPMMTQGAMVFPVVTRGMIEPSAMRRCSIP